MTRARSRWNSTHNIIVRKYRIWLTIRFIFSMPSKNRRGHWLGEEKLRHPSRDAIYLNLKVNMNGAPSIPPWKAGIKIDNAISISNLRTSKKVL